MSIASRDGHRTQTGVRAWAIAWPVSLGAHVLVFVLLYFLFAPVGDQLAESNAIRQMRFLENAELLEDRPVVRSHSSVRLGSLLETPAVEDLAPPAVSERLGEGARVIGLSAGEDSEGSLAVFSTARTEAAPEVSFFGSSARGYKIVFVVDRSGSMWDQFSLVCDELVAALAGLGANQQFQLIFFSSGDPVQMEPTDFLPASRVNKQLAYDFLQRIAGLEPVSGPTDPTLALQTALRLPEGPADVVFLLSDGDFSRDVLNRIKKENPRARSQIHTIGFGYQGGSELLGEIAADNRGTFRFVSVCGRPARGQTSLDDLLR